MKKFKIIVCVLLCLGLAFSTAGCGDLFRDPTADIEGDMQEVLDKLETGKADNEYSGKLTVAINYEDDQKKILDTLIEGFEKKYPNIKVTPVQYPSATYVSTLTSMNSSASFNGKYDDFPDVFWTAQAELPGYLDLDMLMPIDYFDKKDDEFSFDDLFETMVDDSSINSHVYMMPRDSDRVAMYYNKAYTDALHLEIPSDRALTRKEFCDMLDACRGMTTVDASGNPVAVYALDAYWNWESILWPLVKAYGGSVVDVDESGKTVASLNNAGTAAAYGFIKEMSLKNYFPALDTAANGSLFKNKQAVFHFNSRATLSTLSSYVADMQVAPMPNLFSDTDASEKYYVGAGCSGYAMYRHTSHVTEAWLFQKYVAGEEGQNRLAVTGNNVPVLNKLYTDPQAAWRNTDKIAVSTLRADFNHAAFVYDYENCSLTTQMGYKERIRPITAISNVSKAFTESVVSAVNYTDADNYATRIPNIYLKLFANSINDEIDLALAK